MWVCAAAVQQLVLFFLYTSIVSRPVEFVKWPVAADRSHLVHPEAPGCRVFRRAVPPPLGGALVCVGWGVGGGVLSSGGLRWRATRSNAPLSPLYTVITWFNLLLFVYSNFERFLYFSSYYLLNEPVWVVFSCHISLHSLEQVNDLYVEWYIHPPDCLLPLYSWEHWLHLVRDAI